MYGIGCIASHCCHPHKGAQSSFRNQGLPATIVHAKTVNVIILLPFSSLDLETHRFKLITMKNPEKVLSLLVAWCHMLWNLEVCCVDIVQAYWVSICVNLRLSAHLLNNCIFTYSSTRLQGRTTTGLRHNARWLNQRSTLVSELLISWSEFRTETVSQEFSSAIAQHR